MKILFVCTGNTCRSPMAEGMFRELIRKNPPPQGEIMCQSAGLSAVEGAPVSPHAVLACAEIGIDLAEYRARRIVSEEIPRWDAFFTMSNTHAYILEQGGVPPDKIYVPNYIEDPFGGDLSTYRRCRDKLWEELVPFYTRLLGVLS